MILGDGLPQYRLLEDRAPQDRIPEVRSLASGNEFAKKINDRLQSWAGAYSPVVTVLLHKPNTLIVE